MASASVLCRCGVEDARTVFVMNQHMGFAPKVLNCAIRIVVKFLGLIVNMRDTFPASLVLDTVALKNPRS